MIHISTNTVTNAAKQGLLTVVDCPANLSDPTILHEDAAVIEITDPASQPAAFVIAEGKFHYTQQYSDYIPEIDPDLVATEEIDYSALYLEPGHLDRIITWLQKRPDSRRNLVNSWSPICLDPAEVGVCITQLYFRMRNNKLEVHSHARANDAYRLLLLDMQLAIGIQKYVADIIGVTPGTYIHFVDSLHCYKRYDTHIAQQLTYIKTSPLWQA